MPTRCPNCGTPYGTIRDALIRNAPTGLCRACNRPLPRPFLLGCRFAFRRSLILFFGLPITLIVILVLISPLRNRYNVGWTSIVVLVLAFMLALLCINRMTATRRVSRRMSGNSVEERSEHETKHDDRQKP